jgi:hypothetical protein
MPPGASSPSPAQPDRGALSVVVVVAPAAFLAIMMFLDLFKTLPLLYFVRTPPPQRHCSRLQLGNFKYCNWCQITLQFVDLSRWAMPGRPSHPGAVAGARFWPTCGGMADAMVRDGPGGARGGRAGREARWGLCICCIKCTLLHFSLVMCVCIYHKILYKV